jgi:N-methylhydantoinase A
MQVTDLRHDVARTFVGELDALDTETMTNAFNELEASAQRFMDAHEDIPAEPDVRFSRRLDLRYVGQFHPLTLDLPPGSFADVRNEIGGLFHQAHEQRYGHSAEAEPIEVSALRVTATRAVLKQSPAADDSPEEHDLPARDVLFDNGETLLTTVLHGHSLEPGRTFLGPAIVEEDTTHIVVPPKARAIVLPGRHILLEIDGGES